MDDFAERVHLDVDLGSKKMGHGTNVLPVCGGGEGGYLLSLLSVR